MKRYNIVHLLLLTSLFSFAQLKPSIGLTNKPVHSDLICKEPFFNGSFYSSGFQVGDTVPDFKLYDLNGDSLLLSQKLSGGKPVLLIAGSLTCPVFRQKVNNINQVVSAYSNSLSVFIIYTIEAHPTDTSVYFGYVNLTSQNQNTGILFPEPLNYGDRLKLADTMKTWVNLSAPVFIDGPCNTWWKNFGPAPNNSYLIGTNGVVLNKHGWFNKYPDNIFCDLDSVLNVNTGLCAPTPTQTGNFTLNVINAQTFGPPGSYLYDFVDIINTSTVSTTLKIKKLFHTLPSTWQTAICADICYSTSDDSVIVNIDPMDTIHFSLDFLTDNLPDSGSVRIGFKNLNKSNNSFSMWLSANTLQVPVNLKEQKTIMRAFKIFPNPAADWIHINTGESEFSITVIDGFGKEIVKCDNTEKIKTRTWPEGIYHLLITTEKQTRSQRVIISRSEAND